MCLGFSGGGDSTALLHLLARAFPRRRRIALIVDHGVQAASASVAQAALRAAIASGAEAKVLRLERPGLGQARWRAARYEALFDAVRAEGGDRLILAHTRDDQAETVLMRARRGSSWRGLAGMAALCPAPAWPRGRGLWLARPLLAARREDLRGWLERQDHAWHEDPANADPRFDRPRLRQELAAAPGMVERLATLADSFAAARAREDMAVSAALKDAAFEDGWIKAPMADWSALAAPARARALAVLIAAGGGRGIETPEGAIGRLSAGLADGLKAGVRGGAHVKVKRGALWVGRERGRLLGGRGLPDRAAQTFSAAGVWDGRYEIAPRAGPVRVQAAGAGARDPTAPVADGPALIAPLARERLARELWRACPPAQLTGL